MTFDEQVAVIKLAVDSAPNGVIFANRRLERVTFTKEELLSFAQSIRNEIHDKYVNRYRFTICLSLKGKHIATQQFDLNVSNGDSVVIHLDNLASALGADHIMSDATVLAEYMKQESE